MKGLRITPTNVLVGSLPCMFFLSYSEELKYFVRPISFNLLIHLINSGRHR